MRVTTAGPVTVVVFVVVWTEPSGFRFVVCSVVVCWAATVIAQAINAAAIVGTFRFMMSPFDFRADVREFFPRARSALFRVRFVAFVGGDSRDLLAAV